MSSEKIIKPFVQWVGGKRKIAKQLIRHIPRELNNYYEPFRMDVGELREVWYVRAKISPFLPTPQNINNMISDEMIDLRNTIRNQTKMIENLNSTINKLVNKV